MTQSKYFVLDTNVLIHNPTSLYSFSDNIVVLPITVIEELDTFKTLSDKKGMHARQILRELDSLVRKGALDKGAKLPTGGALQILFQPKKSNLPSDLDYSIHDNKILAVAKELQNQKLDVFFISKDANARIKSEALGIKSRDYEKQQVKYSDLYKGWRHLELPKNKIDELYSKKELELKAYTLHDNEFAHITAKDNEKSSALCRYNAATKTAKLVPEFFEAMNIKPINLEQNFAFDLLLDPKVNLISLVGQAGTGKTLLALACGLQQVIGHNPIYEKLLVARPIIPLGKDIGYLPGTKDQKLNYWMQPIFDNLHYILHKHDLAENKDQHQNGKKSDKIDYLIDSGMIEIEAITYIRGRSIPNQFMIIDEAQNLTPHEIKTIISRAGNGTKIVLTGDPDQIDNPYLDANSNGLSYSAERLKNHAITGHVLLSKSERSKLASLAIELL